MTMPKASVNKNSSPVFFEYDIRFSGEVPDIDSVSEPFVEQEFTNHYLGFRIFTSDSGHVETTGFF